MRPGPDVSTACQFARQRQSVTVDAGPHRGLTYISVSRKGARCMTYPSGRLAFGISVLVSAVLPLGIALGFAFGFGVPLHDQIVLKYLIPGTLAVVAGGLICAGFRLGYLASFLAWAFLGFAALYRFSDSLWSVAKLDAVVSLSVFALDGLHMVIGLFIAKMSWTRWRGFASANLRRQL